MLYTEPPPYRFFGDDKPTLLVCWWCTIFACVIIIFRVCGRYVRSEELFLEDKVALACNVPILIRMGVVHVVLLFGTNNTDFGGLRPSENEIWRRQVGSRLVMMSRIFYAASLWMLKFAIIFYLKRITDNIYKKTYSLLVKIAYGCFTLTFIASVVASLAECQPFTHYWQVQPTPDGACRQGFAQLITMAVGNVTSDLILVLLPLPIVWSSKLARKKQIQISFLFCLSLVPVGITLYRVPTIIHNRGAQAQRSLWASIEILFATSAANALVLGTFVRDRGTKKNKYKFGSGDTIERRRSTLRTRDTNLHKRWGSDEDLVRDLGLSVSRGVWEERLTEEGALPQQPAAVARPDGPYSNGGYMSNGSSKSLGGKATKGSGVNKHWRFPPRQPGSRSHGDNISEETESIIASASQTGLSSNPRSPVLSALDVESPVSSRDNGNSKLTFFDVGNLLRADDDKARDRQNSDPRMNQIQISHEQHNSHHHRKKSSMTGMGTVTTITGGSQPHHHAYWPSRATNAARSNSTTHSPHASGTIIPFHPGLQRATTSPPFPYSAAFEPGDVTAPRAGSAVFLQDVGGLLEGGPPISVSVEENTVVSPLSLNDPLGSRNAEAAAKEVMGYWERERTAPGPPQALMTPEGEIEMQTLGPTSISTGERPGMAIVQKGASRKGKGSVGGGGSKSGFSFLGHELSGGIAGLTAMGRGRGRERDGVKSVLPPTLSNGRADGGEQAAMTFTDVGGLLK